MFKNLKKLGTWALVSLMAGLLALQVVLALGTSPAGSSRSTVAFGEMKATSSTGLLPPWRPISPVMPPLGPIVRAVRYGRRLRIFGQFRKTVVRLFQMICRLDVFALRVPLISFGLILLFRLPTCSQQGKRAESGPVVGAGGEAVVTIGLGRPWPSFAI